jgi:hypothetical protein
MTRKRTSHEELLHLSAALDEAILNASDDEISDDLSLLGFDPDKVAADMKAATDEAIEKAAGLRLARAKEAAAAFRSKVANAAPADRSTQRARSQNMRSALDSGAMMMAARKGKKHSPDDEDGLQDDLAQLDALGAEEPQVPKK